MSAPAKPSGDVGLGVVADLVAGAALVVEGMAAAERYGARVELFRAAEADARKLGRKLVVVGDPGAGLHTRIAPAYGCGDLCVDLAGCPGCPAAVAHDLCAGPVPGVEDGGAVVFVSCVLEYVSDPRAAWAECLRMAGDASRVYLVTVQGWTMTAALYPGARWVITRRPDGGIDAAPVTGLDEARAALTAAGGAHAVVRSVAAAVRS